MRYTPGRLGSDARSSRTSNVATDSSDLAEDMGDRTKSGSAFACSFPAEMASDRPEDAPEHRRSYAPRVRVVAAAVITVEQTHAPRQRVDRPMRERMIAAAQRQRAHHGIVSDPAQRENRGVIGEHRQLGGEIRIAVANLDGQRLV